MGRGTEGTRGEGRWNVPLSGRDHGRSRSPGADLLAWSLPAVSVSVSSVWISLFLSKKTRCFKTPQKVEGKAESGSQSWGDVPPRPTPGGRTPIWPSRRHRSGGCRQAQLFFRAPSRLASGCGCPRPACQSPVQRDHTARTYPGTSPESPCSQSAGKRLPRAPTVLPIRGAGPAVPAKGRQPGGLGPGAPGDRPGSGVGAARSGASPRRAEAARTH